MGNAAKLLMLSCVVAQVAGCGTGAALEYGDAAAHFNEGELLKKGEPYLEKKIVVKGTVSKHDIRDAEDCMVYLEHSICCNFGDLKTMAQNCTEGDTIFVMGILKRLEEGDILLEPAMKRDPNADFNPQQ